MTRRQLLIALGAGVLVTPLVTFAQQIKKSNVVGVLRYGSQISSEAYVAAFKQGLHELGYTEGKNLTLQLRFADGNAERLTALAEELVRLKVDVILAMDRASTRAAQRATSVIPIVIGTSTDPVGSGFVASLVRLGGNTTGLAAPSDVNLKRLEMLIAVIPKLSRVAVLLNPSNPTTSAVLKNLEKANERAGLKLQTLDAGTPEQIERAFAAMVKERIEGVIITNDAFFTQHRNQIAGLTLKNHIPSVGANRAHADAGLLMSYGPNIANNYRRAATFVAKILKGNNPSDLPIEEPTKFELVLNMKTAKALRLTIPQSLLINADKVIK